MASQRTVDFVIIVTQRSGRGIGSIKGFVQNNLWGVIIIGRKVFEMIADQVLR